MAKQAICISCDMQFPSEQIFEAHKAAGHSIPGVSLHEESKPRITQDQAERLEQLDQAKKGIESPEVPPGIPPEALPSPEFIETIKRLESDPPPDPTALAEHKAEMQKIIDQKVAEDNRPAVLISLTYQFLGECPNDKTTVTTLEIDVDNKHFVVAYCSQEKKQLESREVVKL